MDVLLRASLVTLALMSVLGALMVMVRPADERRLERVGLALHHGVTLGVALAAAMGALLGGGDGRPLMLCAVGPLLVLALHDMITQRAAMWTMPLVVLGLVVQALVLFGVLPAAWAGAACAALTFAAAVTGLMVCLLRARAEPTPRARSLKQGQALILAVTAVAALLAVLPEDAVGGVWAVALGAASALGTAVRLKPRAPPDVRDAGTAAVACLFVWAAAASIPLPPGIALYAAAWVAFTTLGATALVRASWDSALEHRARLVGAPGVARAAPSASLSSLASLGSMASSPSVSAPPAVLGVPSTAPSSGPSLGSSPPSAPAPMPSAEALAVMAPFLDDAILRRPGRPRLLARVPARRVLEAALERARTTQPVGSGRRDDVIRIEVVAPEAEVDLEGDPADLAEALCAVLDNALRLRALQPEVRIQVHIRSSPGSVTFEVTDSIEDGADAHRATALPDPEAPFMNPRSHDVDRPGLGVALARARLLMERNGGMLLTHFSAEGSTVKLTVPRRTSRVTVGQA